MPSSKEPITLTKPATIKGKTYPRGAVIGSVEVTEGVPSDRALNALRNGCAVLGELPKEDGDSEKKPANSDKPAK